MTITRDSTGVSYRQTTTDAGFYSFPSIPVGPYTVAQVGSPSTSASKSAAPPGR